MQTELKPEQGTTHRPPTRNRLYDIAWVLPAGGLFLLNSPLLNAVTSAGFLAGIPVRAIYVFGVWFALIAGTALLARRLYDGGSDA